MAVSTATGQPNPNSNTCTCNAVYRDHDTLLAHVKAMDDRNADFPPNWSPKEDNQPEDHHDSGILTVIATVTTQRVFRKVNPGQTPGAA